MLKSDKQAFLDLVSGNIDRVGSAIMTFQKRERGHFEDHPMSGRLVKEHLTALIDLYGSNPVEGSRDWATQLIADARVADARVKPILTAALADPACNYLPTLLYLAGSQPDVFEDIGAALLPLAKHPDPEVRWRVAWVISKMKHRDTDMLQALDVLSLDAHPTTTIYVKLSRAQQTIPADRPKTGSG